MPLFLGLSSLPPTPDRLPAFASAMPLLSHRGGSLERIENTLGSFRNSASLQTPLILEMDLCMTKDGQIVVFHDNDMMRLCGVPGRIEDFSYEQLPLLLVPTVLVGKVSESDTQARMIPLFEQVLSEFPGFPMSVDVKHGSEEMIIKTGKLIQKYKREQLTIWGSFLSKQSDCCYKHFGSKIPLFFSIRRFFLSWFLSLFGLTRWMHYRESHALLPNFWMFLRPSWFADLNREGISVTIWGMHKDIGKGPNGGINTIEGFERVRRAGANGIGTDSPSLLKEWLRSNPMLRVDRFLPLTTV
ncbi:Lysophospholipase D gdpd1 [Chytriomyces hyalinus]|nr:Lysophospholipase D gdpd1 [Chytriomyces hyalinus]